MGHPRGTPYCFARKDVGDPTGYLTLLVADYTRRRGSHALYQGLTLVGPQKG